MGKILSSLSPPLIPYFNSMEEKQISEDRRQQQGTMAVPQHGRARTMVVVGAHKATYTLHIISQSFLDFSNSALDRTLTQLLLKTLQIIKTGTAGNKDLVLFELMENRIAS